MYEGVVYFAGPRSRWLGAVDPSEVIFRCEHRWKWLARVLARSAFSRLDSRRCGYALLQEGQVIEHHEPPQPEPEAMTLEEPFKDGTRIEGLHEMIRRHEQEVKDQIGDGMRRGHFH